MYVICRGEEKVYVDNELVDVEDEDEVALLNPAIGYGKESVAVL